MKKFVLAALAAITIASSASAQTFDRRVRVNNFSSETIVVVNGSNVSRSSWEENIIAGSPIYPGSSRIINFNDGSGYCSFDVRALTASGKSIVRANLNVCTTENWTLAD